MSNSPINLICPDCGLPGRARTLTTYQTVGGAEIARRRQCPHCKHRWRTVEISMKEKARLLREAEMFRLLRKALSVASIDVAKSFDAG